MICPDRQGGDHPHPLRGAGRCPAALWLQPQAGTGVVSRTDQDQRVGPKLALAILSGMTATQFVLSVEREEINSWSSCRGWARRPPSGWWWTGSRLGQPRSVLAVGSPCLPESALRAPDSSEEAASALVALGYKPQQASQIVSKVAADGMSVEDIIREALRSLV